MCCVALRCVVCTVSVHVPMDGHVYGEAADFKHATLFSMLNTAQ